MFNATYRTLCRIRYIEQHAADNVDKILVGNKCDMISEKVFYIFSKWGRKRISFSAYQPIQKIAPTRRFTTKRAPTQPRFIPHVLVSLYSFKVVETARGQALADEYSIKFFETSAKSSINVVEAFTSIVQDIKKRLMDNPNAAPSKGIHVEPAANTNKKCC